MINTVPIYELQDITNFRIGDVIKVNNAANFINKISDIGVRQGGGGDHWEGFHNVRIEIPVNEYV